MELLTHRLLNDFQRDFPLSPAPFAQIAKDLNTTSETVLQTLKLLQHKGAVSRVGPVFRPNTIGVSTLAAIAVPAERLEQVAAVVNKYSQVNHNYEREHYYNLWFVVTTNNSAALEKTLQEIEKESGYKVLVLPLLRDYHIDLGFHMHFDKDISITSPEDESNTLSEKTSIEYSYIAEDLIEAVQSGIPLVPRPYQEIGNRLGWSEQVVIDQLGSMIHSGVIKRLGVVVRHHELGYRANAMVVWNVPDGKIDELGKQLGQQDCVTLCYQRPRRLPEWPYNLFCMVHGRDRADVLACIDRMIEGLSLESVSHDVLFSGRRFKQRGARYRTVDNGQS